MEPPRLPIREAAKRVFRAGVRQVLLNLDQSAPDDFLSDAGRRGFIYPPDCEAYYLAQDFACWIEGAMRVVEELGLDVRELSPLRVGDERLSLDGFISAQDILHLFRISDDGDDKWDSLCAQLFIPSEIHIHSLHLPSVRAGRLPSPLVMLYKHPSLNLLRLAPLEGESFSAKWKRSARWESRYEWKDWREGIDRDRCLDRIYSHSTIPLKGSEELLEIRSDIEIISPLISSNSPRKREVCGRCLYHQFCHGDSNDRSQFITRNAATSMQQL